MNNAIPADVPETDESDLTAERRSTSAEPTSGANASEPVAPTVSSPSTKASALAGEPVPSTAGKLFFSWDGNDYVCSGATINSATKDLVETAGHCVYETGQGWHSNIAFAPGYYNGLSSYGLWNWETARTFDGWINNGDFSRDQAFVAFNTLGGNELVNVVGGNGLAYGYGTAQTGVRVWGWPAEAPYAGETPHYCDGSTTDRSILDDDAQIACDMTGGASGGPWLLARIDANLGSVFAVTSRRTTSGTPYLIATPNSADVKTMFDLMT